MIFYVAVRDNGSLKFFGQNEYGWYTTIVRLYARPFKTLEGAESAAFKLSVLFPEWFGHVEIRWEDPGAIGPTRTLSGLRSHHA